MPVYSNQFVQQVAQATDIVDLVGQYVALKKRGREYVGLCPFHDDHKPSMCISPTKQIYKCFSCGAGGGVFQFLIQHDRLTFPEAVRALAERANIPLPREAAPAEPAGTSKADLTRLMLFAGRFFRAALRGEAGASALDYARSRGLTDESIDRFGLGWAPPGWDNLLRAARREGFSEAQLVAGGLAARNEQTGHCYDRFRNRLMFPIIDVAGKVIAFGGRALDADDPAKYLNSPESILFDKSSQLYALNWSREQISSCGQAVVVEGYLDALIPLQAGVGNVVATLGTSLTERHVRLLSRYAREAVLVFDADAAGTAAAERGLELFLAQRLHVRVATIPAGKDPCDYTLAEGAEAMKKLVDQAPDAILYAWGRRQEQLRSAGGNLADRQRVIEGFLTLVVSSAAYGAIDAVRRGQLAQHIAQMLNLSAMDLQRQMARLARRIRAGRPGSGRPAESWGPDQPAGVLAERDLLGVLLNRPELFDQVAERIDWHDFQDARLRAVAEAVWSAGQAGRLSLDDILAAEAMAEMGALLTDLASAGERQGRHEQVLQGAMAHLLYLSERARARDLLAQQVTDEALRDVWRRGQLADPRRTPRLP